SASRWGAPGSQPRPGGCRRFTRLLGRSRRGTRTADHGTGPRRPYRGKTPPSGGRRGTRKGGGWPNGAGFLVSPCLLPSPPPPLHAPLRGPPLTQMVQLQRADLDASFAALSDATRRGILERLGHADASITELAERFRMTLTGMKKHVGVLEQAGLVA